MAPKDMPIASEDVLLTAPSGPLGPHCSEVARKLVAIFASGQCFMAKGADGHPEVASILTLARLQGIDIGRPIAVDTGTIRGLYHHHPKQGPSITPEISDELDDGQMRDHIYSLLAKAIEKRGVSDVFVRYNREEGRVFAAIDGQMEPLIEMRWPPGYAKQFVRATMAWAGAEGSSERGYQEGAHQVGQITQGLPPGLQSVRLQKLAVGFTGESLIIRLMPTPADGRIDLTALRFSEAEIEQFDSMIFIASGIIAVTGPTGAGKTTTLHGMLSRLLAMFPGDHWVTAEDPIEIRIHHDNVDQIDVVRTATDDDVALSYRKALEAALRSAPHRLLFGEIRSEDTAAIAVRAALTGHQVLTTLHTDGCMQVVARLMDLGVSGSMLRNQGVLRGISSQRLLRRLCPRCRRPSERSQWLGYCPAWLEKIFKKDGGVYLPDIQGCGHCRGGYVVGRKVVTEIMRLDDRLTGLLVEGRTAEALDHWRATGGVPLLDRAGQLVAAGEFDPYEVIRCLNS